MNGIETDLKAMKLFSFNSIMRKGFDKMSANLLWEVVLVNEDETEETIYVENRVMLFRIRAREYISYNEKFYVLDKFNKLEKTARYYESVEK